MLTNTKSFLMPLIVVVLFALGAGTACAGTVDMMVALGQPVVLQGAKHLNYLKIGLTGQADGNRWRRTPVNVAIVLDRSGSMQGEKLAHARRAAIMAVERLDKADIVSVIAYDSHVKVIVPATKAREKYAICRAIEQLEAGSNTALFAGVSKGAAEVRKFLDRERVNRIILLSDGLANEGPSTPNELGELGASLKKEGISVTTLGLGLGYNEDLMSQLANRSDGNNAFIENPEDLARVFDREFGDVLSVVAKEVTIKIRVDNGRPVRVLGREADIRDREVTAVINQLYSNQEKYVLLEVEMPAGEANATLSVAEVTVTYANLLTNAVEKLTGQASARFTASPAEVAANENSKVMVSAVDQLANERFKLATRLRDEGKIEEAKKALRENRAYLESSASKYQAPSLSTFAEQNTKAEKDVSEADWNRARKTMRNLQNVRDQQQAW